MPKKQTKKKAVKKVAAPAPTIGLQVLRGELQGTISRLNENESFSVKTAAGFIHQARLAPAGEWAAAN